MTRSTRSPADVRSIVLPQTADVGQSLGARVLVFVNDDMTCTVLPTYIRPLNSTDALPFLGDDLLVNAAPLRLENVPLDRLAHAVHEAWGATLHGPILGGISHVEHTNTDQPVETIEMVSLPVTVPTDVIAGWVRAGLAQPQTLAHAEQAAA